MPAIVVQDLHKSYGSHVALRGIDFEVDHGEVVGFLGPNGAGKTTTMRILTGFLASSAGSTRIEGHDVVSEPLLARQKIGYLPENGPLYEEMTPLALLNFFGDARSMNSSLKKSRIEQVIEQCALNTVLNKPIGKLSRGFRQRVGMANVLLHERRRERV